MVFFGQVVIGTAGSGKTTYCQAMGNVLPAMKRHTIIVNLDAANEGNLPYTAAASVSELLEKSDDARHGHESLGPNGAVMYTMELLEHNLAWLDRVVLAAPPRSYFIFDCPGQLELYTHHMSMTHIFEHLREKFDMRLCAVHLLDSVVCVDASTFISGLMTSLSAMVNLELPHVNVLSKIDLLPNYGPLPFDLSYLEEGQDLGFLAQSVSADKRFAEKYGKLTEAICEVVENYSLVSFVALSVKNAKSLNNLLIMVDKANGYSISGVDPVENPAFLLQASQLFDSPLGELGDEEGELLLEAVSECYDMDEAIREAKESAKNRSMVSDSDSDSDENNGDGTIKADKSDDDDSGSEEDDDIGQPPPLEYTK